MSTNNILTNLNNLFNPNIINNQISNVNNITENSLEESDNNTMINQQNKLSIIPIKQVNKKIKKITSIPFPDVIVEYEGRIIPLNTMNNLKVFLEWIGISYNYDVILKKPNINIDNINIEGDDLLNTQFSYLKSECIKEGLQANIVDNYFPALIDQANINPLMDMVKSKPWDGIDRIKQFTECLKSNDSEFYKDFICKIWFIQCIAAWDYIKECPIEDALPKFESVLVLVGEQGLRKTTVFELMLPFNFREYISTGINLDTHNKDSIKNAITAGITELGELDSTFSRDIPTLKAFLSNKVDKMRLPYARSETLFKRRTSFGASVNSKDFLVDRTGNRRFLPILLIDILEDKLRKIDKQQLFAQAYVEYRNGSKWWIDKKVDSEVYEYLNLKHEEHQMFLPEDEIAKKVIDNTLNKTNSVMYRFEWKTATEIANFYNIQANQRKMISNIKEKLKKSGIENKNSTFKVVLIHDNIEPPKAIN